MEAILLFSIAIITVLIVYIITIKVKEVNNNSFQLKISNKRLPYKLKESILSQSERIFYKNFFKYYSNDNHVFAKVTLKDIFYIGLGVDREYMKYFNKICQKQVDFLICSKETYKPLYAIELDETIQNNKKTQKKDDFNNRAFETAGLVLVHVPTQKQYTKKQLDKYFSPQKIEEANMLIEKKSNTPVCPKCGASMVLRKFKEGKDAGKEYYGCLNYPNCEEIILLANA